ncbi:hypothetical protein Tco_0527026 [Tanacetum coccineum]
MSGAQNKKRKERVKSRRVRGMILAAQSEVFKQENVLAERLHSLDPQMERKRDEGVYFMDRIWVLLVGSVMDEAHASRFETYVKSKDLDLWHVITDGDFLPIKYNFETKKDEIVPFHKQDDDLKKKLAKNNEAKMEFKKFFKDEEDLCGDQVTLLENVQSAKNNDQEHSLVGIGATMELMKWEKD